MRVVCNRQITTAQRNYQRYYQLRMRVALTSLTSTLNIAKMRKISFLFDFLFNIYGCFLNNYDLRSSDVKKKSNMASKSVILHFNGFHKVYALFQWENGPVTEFWLQLKQV